MTDDVPTLTPAPMTNDVPTQVPAPLPLGMHDFKLRQAWTTQGAIGRRQMEDKRRDLRKLIRHPTKFLRDILTNPIVAVLGPSKPEEASGEVANDGKRKKDPKNGKCEEQGNAPCPYGIYIIDHNHLGLAMIGEDFEDAPMVVHKDWRDMEYHAFIARMHAEGLIRARDENGKDVDPESVIRKLVDMPDDPYRSLARSVRREGGFSKPTKMFGEFEWADYFRAHISKKELSDNFNNAVKKATRLAQKLEASTLPGYKGLVLN